MNIKDVETLAELAKLELTETEKAEILKDMEGILSYVKVIEEIEVPEIDVEYENRNVWREDVVPTPNSFSSELVGGQFPDTKDGFLKVKKIL